MSNSSLFRTKALERASSPDQLNQYIRVANPRAWIALVIACLLIVAGLATLTLVRMPVTEQITVTIENGQISAETDIPDGDYQAEITVNESTILDMVLGP